MYDTLPMYTEELLMIQNNSIKSSQGRLLFENDNNKNLNYIQDFPDPFYIGKVASENELNPYIKIGAYKVEVAVAIGENISSTIVFDLRN